MHYLFFFIMASLAVALAQWHIIEKQMRAMRGSHNVADWFKVPRRDVYCQTFWLWIKACFRSHVWLQVAKFFRSPLPKLGILMAVYIAISLASTGCGTKLAAGGAYNLNPTGTNGVDSSLPDVGFYLADSSFDLAETTLDAAFKIEANNRVFLYQLNPGIKHGLDSIRKQSWSVIGDYTKARAKYIASHDPASLTDMQTANNQISTLSAQATDLVTTTNSIAQ